MGLLEANISDDRNLPYVLMVSMMNSAVDANVEAFGHDLAFKMFSPYIRLNAKWCVDHFPVYVGRDFQGIDGLLSLLLWNFHMSNRAPMRCRVTDEGSVEIEIVDCRTGGQYPNMCEWWCDREQAMMCEESNPDLVLTKELSICKGDDRCLWSIRSKGGRLEVAGLGTDFQTVVPSDTPAEIFDYISFAGPTEYLTNATTNLVETIDREKAAKLLITRATEAGRDLGALFLQRDENRKVDRAETLLLFIDNVLQMEGQEIVRDDNSLKRAIDKCPFIGCLPEVCEQIKAMRIGALSIVSPKHTISFEEKKGSSSCIWCLEKRKGLSRSADTDDEHEQMLKLLKWRLVKGEITNEDYERLREAISR